MAKTITVVTTGCPLISFADLDACEFNSLKQDKGRDVSKLKKAIKSDGFLFPFYIWKRPEGPSYCIDGAGRHKALVELAAEGYEIPALPFVEVTAPDLATAKRFVLMASSQHGRVTQKSFESFIADIEIEPEVIELVELPQVDLEVGLGIDLDFEPEDDEIPDDHKVEQLASFGDVWLLGRHKIICGDATDPQTVARLFAGVDPFLMVTDPPYGVEYDPRWRGETGVSAGTKSTALVTNDSRVNWVEAWRLFPGVVAYVWHANVYLTEVGESLIDAGFKIRSQIIWVKPQFVVGRGAYHVQHEPCFYAAKGTAKWQGGRKQSTVWEIPTLHKSHGELDGVRTAHATQKPIECMARPIRNHGEASDIVYDPFLGSGSTIMAAEQLGRTCYGVEIEPSYCDIIIDRWQRFTGETASRVRFQN